MTAVKEKTDHLWEPSLSLVSSSHLKQFADFAGQPLYPYERLHRWSTARRDEFWSALWDYAGIIGDKGDSVYEPGETMADDRWFPEATLNFAENLLRGNPERTAAQEADEEGLQQAISVSGLREQVAKVQHGLMDLGVQKGDRVAGIITNQIEGLVALLATTSLGAVWTSCSPDFGAKGITDRIGQVEPKVLIATVHYQYKGKEYDIRDKVKETFENLEKTESLITQKGQIEGSITWESLLEHPAATPIFEQVPFDHPLYILYTSGTTGLPKAIVHSTGGTLLQHLKEHQLHCDVQKDDTLFWYTNTAWMMYPWLVSGLASEATLLLYDGSPAPAHSLTHLWEIADEAGITHFGTSPKYLETLQKEGVHLQNSHSLTSLKSLLSCGAPLAPEQYDWIYDTIKSDLLLASISGGTEIIGCFIMGSPIHPVKRGELTCKALGMAVDVWDERGASVYEQKGDLVCTESFPSMPITFYGENGDERYRSSYFSKRPGIWTHGDLAEQTLDEAFIIYGRADTTLNPGGIRIGTAEIYRVTEHLPGVEDSLVFGWPKGNDEEIVLCITGEITTELAQSIRREIRSKASPRHIPKRIYQVPSIPYTNNGKKVEGAAKTAALGGTVKNKASIQNPESLEAFGQLEERTYY
ncbi:acetoacetate--CoA ligase [Salimicrobium halophilum]|uniref:Acetoacetyl-CoA synthetase n=1 Tax=Salimicrobium halophilum TaxID=86666 RepID=A0A1G8T7T9_9BACI|nr:acetoacetate--CoA ligase [Salimicrobium halophilum]SDJ37626.1 acetoacetyl-CoA synthetase [Salimicrobium halophilum]